MVLKSCSGWLSVLPAADCCATAVVFLMVYNGLVLLGDNSCDTQCLQSGEVTWGSNRVPGP